MDAPTQRDDAACPACQTKAFAVEYRLPDGFRTVKCKTCGFITMTPYPSDAFLHDHYKARALYGAYSAVRADYDRAVQDRAALVRISLQGHPDFAFCGRAIDFGAGAGIAVAALTSLGFDAEGIETNPQAAQTARDLFGVKVSDRSLDDIARDLRLFTIFEVLEHIKYPADFLRTVHEKLVPGGFVVGSVPNYNSLGRLVLGTKSIALAFPEHITQFTSSTLRRTLEDGGFTVEYIGHPPPYGVVITLGLRPWLVKTLGRNAVSAGLGKVLTFLKKYLFYPLPNLIVRRTGFLAHGLVFAARKPPVRS